MLRGRSEAFLQSFNALLETGNIRPTTRRSKALTDNHRIVRRLHAAFFDHGACGIRLPAWWVLYLQSQAGSWSTPGQNNPRVRCSSKHGFSEIATSTQQFFLDFLRPLTNLSSIHRHRSAAALHRRAEWKIRNSTRAYTSIANEIISAGSVNAGVKSTKSSQHESEAHGVSISPQRVRLAACLDKSTEDRSPDTCEKLWQACQEMADANETPSALDAARIMRVLRQSPRIEDHERLIALFNRISGESRKPMHYQNAILAALKLNDTNLAFAAFDEALDAYGVAIEAGALVAHAARTKDCRLGHQVWRKGSQLGLAFFVNTDLWSGYNLLSFAEKLEASKAMTEYALGLAHNRSSENDLASSQMAAEFIRKMFLTKPPSEIFGGSSQQSMGPSQQANTHAGTQQEKFLQDWHTLLAQAARLGEVDPQVPLSSIKDAAFSQLFSAKTSSYSAMAIERFHAFVDSDPNYTPSKKVLTEALFLIDPHFYEDFLWLFLRCWQQQKYGSLSLGFYLRWMKQYATRGDLQSALSMFEAYGQDRGKIKDADVGDLLLKTYTAQVKIQEAEAVLAQWLKDSIFVPTCNTYCIMISGYARIGDQLKAREWLTKLKQAGFKPNVYAYTPLLTLYAKRGDREMSAALWKEVREEGIEPDARMQDTEVLALVHIGEFERAESFLMESTVKAKLMRPQTWNSVLMGLGFRRNIKGVRRLADQMKNCNVPYTHLTYSTLMAAYALNGHTDHARRLLEEDMPKAEITPVAIHYAAVMGGYLRDKDYGSIIRLYQTMIESGVKPTISTKNILLRASGEVDREINKGANVAEPFQRTRELLRGFIEELDPQELATVEPRKLLGPFRLDEAFQSAYFEYAIFLFGSSKAFEMVLEAYDQYMKSTARLNPRKVEGSIPTRMLTALLSAHKSAGNNEDVEKCWALALEKFALFVRKSSASGQNQRGWVLLSYKYSINPVLMQYLDFLGERGLYDQMVGVVRDLLFAGYGLTHRNWNKYIQYLTQSPEERHLIKAFRLTETILMDYWPGWTHLEAGSHGFKSRLRGLGARVASLSSSRAPNYQTIVSLASAAVILDRSGALKRLEEEKTTFRTLEAIYNLPPKNDLEQRVVRERLYGSPHLPEHLKKTHNRKAEARRRLSEGHTRP